MRSPNADLDRILDCITAGIVNGTPSDAIRDQLDVLLAPLGYATTEKAVGILDAWMSLYRSISGEELE